MAFNDYQKTTLLKYRAGTPEDPYINITETKRVFNSKIMTNEIPVRENKIFISGMYEVDSDDMEDLTLSQYRVDYNEGGIYFHISLEGQQKTYSYRGRGNHFVSAGRVWVREENGNIVETLDQIIEAGRTSIEGAKDLTELINRTETSIVSANTAANSANTKATLADTKAVLAQQQADYAKIQGDAAKLVVTQVQGAVDKANDAADYATEISAVIQGMVDNVEENSNYAKAQGDYAKTQGDYAKSKGDQAYDYGTSFVNRGVYNGTTAYKTLNIVSYGNVLYQAIANTQGNLPTNTAYWAKILETSTSTTWASILDKPNVEGHIADKNNPHAVTAAQISAYTKQEVDTIVENVTAGKFDVIDSYTSTDKTKPNSADALRRALDAAKVDAEQKASITLLEARAYTDMSRPPAASTTTVGSVQLNDTTSSTSKTTAGTADSVRRAKEEAKAEAIAAFGSLNQVIDNRNVEGAPSIYKQGTTQEFKLGTSIGLDAETYVLLETHKPWTDASGGRAHQIAFGGTTGMRYRRTSTTSGSDWSTFWYEDIHTGYAWQKRKLTEDNGASIQISNQDLNNIVNTGFYDGTALVNAPTADWYYVQVQRHSNSDQYVIQTIRRLQGGKATYQQRIREGGNWTAWSTDLFEGGVNAVAPVSYYVNGASGNDANSGLSAAAPFKTLQKAINTVPKNIINSNGNTTTIYLSGNTSTEDVTIAGFYGAGTLNISGVSGSTINGKLKIYGCSLRSIACNNFNVTNGTELEYSVSNYSAYEVNSTGNLGYGLAAGRGVNAYIASCDYSNKTSAAVFCSGAIISAFNIRGNNIDTGYWANSGGTIAYSNNAMNVTRVLSTQDGGGAIRT